MLCNPYLCTYTLHAGFAVSFGWTSWNWGHWKPLRRPAAAGPLSCNPFVICHNCILIVPRTDVPCSMFHVQCPMSNVPARSFPSYLLHLRQTSSSGCVFNLLYTTSSSFSHSVNSEVCSRNPAIFRPRCDSFTIVFFISLPSSVCFFFF